MPVACQEICVFPFYFRATFNTRHFKPISCLYPFSFKEEFIQKVLHLNQLFHLSLWNRKCILFALFAKHSTRMIKFWQKHDSHQWAPMALWNYYWTAMFEVGVGKLLDCSPPSWHYPSPVQHRVKGRIINFRARTGFKTCLCFVLFV